MLLIADNNILYGSRIYKAGEKLPAVDSRLLTAWLANGFAHWEDEISEKSEENLPADEKKSQENTENTQEGTEDTQEGTEDTQEGTETKHEVKETQKKGKE